MSAHNTTPVLPAIAGLANMWAKRPEESESEFHDFLDWLERGASRGAPAAKHATLAARHDWAERALSYEQLAKTAASPGVRPEHQIVSNLTRMVQIEAAKLLRLSSAEINPTVTLKDLLATMGLIQSLADAGAAAASSAADLSKLTQDEKKLILQAQLLLRKTSK
jgi:hypothetical protein